MNFKKIIIAIAILAITVCIMSGCNTNKTPEEISTDSAQTNGTEQNETYSEPVSETISEEATEIEETTTKAPETTTAAPETTTAKPETTTKASVDVNTIAQTIASKTNMFEESLIKSSTPRGLSLFGISESDVEEAAYYAASAAVAEEILVVKATSKSAASSILKNIEDRRSMQIEDYADYVPKEVPKLESAVVYQNGEYVVFCVSNNNSAIRTVITNQF